MESSSVLQRRVQLRDIVDINSLRELCQSFSDLYGVAIKIFDSEGDRIVDAKAESGLCGYVFGFPEGRTLCTKLVGEIKLANAEAKDSMEMVCFTGNRYRIVPIQYDHDYLGKIVFGPYFPESLPHLPNELYQIDSRIDGGELDRLAKPYRRLADGTVSRIVTNLSKVIDVLLFTGYKSLLASTMHLEAITESYREMQDKNRQLQESYDRLKELDRLKSNFLATVSHELRTPLTSVIGYSEMLLDGLAGELSTEQGEYVATIMEKGETLLQMISGILDVSKIEAGQLKLNIGEADIKGILEDSMSTVVPFASRKGLALDLETPPMFPPLRVDRDKLQQVFVNLLSNSVKFTPENGSVRVLVDMVEAPGHGGEGEDPFDVYRGKEARIRVIDTGIGIDTDMHGRIFETFYQVDSSSTREYGGAGIGLAIVKSYVEAHRGRVDIESAPGQGCTFFVYLPMDDAS